jgi:MinD-like ATPase involved in chromosome partitioning or flagellar assembly
VIGEHFTLLGLARPRAAWFTEVGRWAMSAALPAEFSRCVSIDDLESRLRGGRAWSAVLVDHRADGADRDLFDLARSTGCAVIVVDDGSRRRPWTDLGASAVLDEPFSASELLGVLRSTAAPVERLAGSGADLAGVVSLGGWQGRLVTVTGAGGTGTSTVAAALAQGAGADPRHGGRVVLLDAALDAAQAVLHDTGDVVPGLQELVEAHRTGALEGASVRELTWACPDHGYELLAGLRRHRDWTALRARAVEAATASLRRTYAVTVADVDPDLEGEALTGSTDVEDRNVLSRHLTATADIVVVTASPTVVGVHQLVRILGALGEHGVAASRVLPVVTRAPKNPRQRAELTRAVHDLLGPVGEEMLVGPCFVSARRDLEGLQRDAAPLPRALTSQLHDAVEAVAARLDAEGARPVDDASQPVPIAPGSLGEELYG